VHDAALDADVVAGGQLVVERADEVEGPLDRQPLAVHVDLERANARRDVHHPRDLLGQQPFHQQVDPDPQAQIEDRLAVLDQQVAVAAAPVRDGGAALLG
jgi:hypothetical protein